MLYGDITRSIYREKRVVAYDSERVESVHFAIILRT